MLINPLILHKHFPPFPSLFTSTMNTLITPLKADKTNTTPRYQCKNWFLTFPQCEVTKQEVLDKLGKSARIEVVGAVIAQETHQDGAHHLHVAIWLKKSTRLPVDYWDFLVGKHGNYARMKNQIGAYKYLHKEDKEPLEYGTVPVAALVKNAQTTVCSTGATRTKMGLADHVAVMCAEPNANIDDIISIHPGFVLRYKKNVEELINHHQVKRERVLKKDWSPVKYNGTQFETSMIVGWLNANLGVDRAPKTRQLYIYGDANTGKTTLLNKLQEYFHTFLIPTHEDWYGEYTTRPPPGLCVADEFKGACFTLQWLNQFVEGSKMYLKVKGGAPRLKTTNPPVIMCSNVSIYHVYRKAIEKNPQMEGTIDARWLEIRLPERLDLENIEWPDDAPATSQDPSYPSLELHTM